MDFSAFSEDDLDYRFSCGVCFEIFENPRTLACGHTICSDCLVGIYRKNRSCPFCRAAFQLPLPATNGKLEYLSRSYSKWLATKEQPIEVEENFFPQMAAAFFQLPIDAAVEICCYLSWREVTRMACVCKQMRRYVEDPTMWFSFCTREFPFLSQDSSYGRTWKGVFKANVLHKVGWERGRPSDFKMTPWRGHQDYINCFQVYRRNVVSGSNDHTVKVWRFGKDSALQTLNGHTDLITCLRFDEISVASGSTDKNAILWDAMTGQSTNKFTHPGAVDCLVLNEESLITGCNDGHVRSWDRQTNAATLDFTTAGAPMKLLYRDNHLTSVSNQEVKIWDTRNAAAALFTLAAANTTCSSFIGDQVITGHSNGLVKVWDMKAGTNTLNHQMHNTTITCIGGDDNTIVTGSTDNSLKVFNRATNAIAHSLADHSAPINALQMDSHKIVSGAQDGSINVWNRVSGQRLYSLLGGSLQQRGRNPPHPTRPGISGLAFDDSRIVASFNALLRTYTFEVGQL